VNPEVMVVLKNSQPFHQRQVERAAPGGDGSPQGQPPFPQATGACSCDPGGNGSPQEQQVNPWSLGALAENKGGQ